MGDMSGLWLNIAIVCGWDLSYDRKTISVINKNTECRIQNAYAYIYIYIYIYT